MNLARKRFTEFKERGDQISDAELEDFWATLTPATIDGMIGEWKGGEFGKTFKSAEDVQPLVCLDAEGNKFSNEAMGKGEASLWLEDFRGEVTTSMVYDGQPVHDHFKKIDDDAVMGIMNGKGVLDNGRYYYFYLERV